MIDVNLLTEQDRKFLKTMQFQGVSAKEAFSRLEAIRPKTVSMPKEVTKPMISENVNMTKYGIDRPGKLDMADIKQGFVGAGKKLLDPIKSAAKSGYEFGRSGAEDIISGITGGKTYEPRTGKYVQKEEGVLGRIGQVGSGAAKVVGGAVETVFSPLAAVLAPEMETIKTTLDANPEIAQKINNLIEKVPQRDRDDFRALVDVMGLKAKPIIEEGIVEGSVAGRKALQGAITKQVEKIPNIIDKGATGIKAGASKVKNVIPDVNFQGVKETAVDTGRFGTRQLTGLQENTLNQLAENPKFIKEAVQNGDFTRQNLTEKVTNALDSGQEQLTNSLKSREGIVDAYFTPNEKNIIDGMKEVGLPVIIDKKTGNLIIKNQGSSRLLLSDIKKLNSSLADTGIDFRKPMTGEKWVTARGRLDGLIDWKTPEGARLEGAIKKLRKNINEQAKIDIPELGKADNAIAQDLSTLKTLKKDYFRFDDQTRSWVLKDNASSKLANLWKNGKVQTLGRLEKIVPGITNDIKTLAAIEDIYNAGGKTVGSYMKSITPLVLGGAVGGGPVGGALGYLAGLYITNPKNAIKLLTSKWGQKFLNFGVGKKAINALEKTSKGIKPTKVEAEAILKVSDDLIKNPNVKSPGFNKGEISNTKPLTSKPKNSIIEGTNKNMDNLINEAKKYDSANEFYEKMGSKNLNKLRDSGIRGKEQVVKWFNDNVDINDINKLDGAMAHRPSFDNMPPAYNLSKTDALPKDVYLKPDWSIGNGAISRGEKSANESWEALKKIKGKPDGEITIYRATPKNELRKGDWVTFSKTYAKNESLEEGTKVYSFKVKAKDVIFAGDDINEFGYWGNKISNE